MLNKILGFLLLLSSLSAYSGGFGNIVSVGTGTGCDVSTVQEGIDNGNEVSVHLSNNQVFHENLTIDGASDLVIVGGFDSCEDAENNIPGENGYSVINGDIDDDGTGDGSVLQIEGSGVVSLKNLKITNGLQGFMPFGHNGGGVSTLGFDGQLKLSDMLVVANQGNAGGGLSVRNGETDVSIGNNVFIHSNSATTGGGIWCDSSALIEFQPEAVNSGIALNNAFIGGGVTLIGDCHMRMFNGRYELMNDLDFRGIVSNSATKNGGGVYLSNGAVLELVGENESGTPVNISANRADVDQQDGGNGGGIYATGENTKVIAKNVFFEKNQAESGAGIYLDENAELTIERGSGICWNQKHCNLIENNTAQKSAGAILANNGAQFSIKQTVIQDNRANNALVALIENGASGMFHGNVITHNGNGGQSFDDNYLMRVHSGAELNILFSTITDNQAVLGVFRTDAPDMTPLSIYGSIIYDEDSGDVVVGPGVHTDIRCVNVHEDNSFNGSQIFFGNPLFKAPFIRDYHLAKNSPMIDKCFPNANVDISDDIDGETRGWNDPTVFNGVIPKFYDVGADETYENDIIFKNGFEILF